MAGTNIVRLFACLLLLQAGLADVYRPDDHDEYPANLGSSRDARVEAYPHTEETNVCLQEVRKDDCLTGATVEDFT